MPTTTAKAKKATSRIDELDLSALAGGGSEPTKPVIADPKGLLAAKASEIRSLNDQIKNLTAEVDGHKADLAATVRSEHFRSNVGKLEIPSSYLIETQEAGQYILVTAQNRYTAVKGVDSKTRKPFDNTAEVQAIVGAAVFADQFEQVVSGRLDFSKVPRASRGKFVTELAALLERHASKSALSISNSILPKDGFHTARHSLLPVAKNVALDEIMPFVVAIKTENVKG